MEKFSVRHVMAKSLDPKAMGLRVEQGDCLWIPASPMKFLESKYYLRPYHESLILAYVKTKDADGFFQKRKNQASRRFVSDPEDKGSLLEQFSLVLNIQVSLS